MKEVTFDAGVKIKNDRTGQLYSEKPQWQKQPEARIPYLYRAGDTLYIESAKWLYRDRQFPRDTVFNVVGYANDGIKIEAAGWVSDVTEAGTEISIADESANSPFPQKTRYSLRIDWEISWGTAEPHEADFCECPIAVCLKRIGDDEHPYRAVVYAACSSDGATSQSTAFQNTWSLFKKPPSPPNATPSFSLSYDPSSPLRYYEAGKGFSENRDALWFLLQNRRGSCVSWRELLFQAAQLNDVVCEKKGIRPITGYLAFLVKEWDLSPLALPPIYQFVFPPNAPNHGFDMVSDPPVDDYFDFFDKEGLAGQNSPTPSEKFFGAHVVLKYDGVYYDPSYGVTYANETAFKGALWGISNKAVTHQDSLWMVVSKPAGQWVQFTDE